jgi:hypothetical protein
MAPPASRPPSRLRPRERTSSLRRTPLVPSTFVRASDAQRRKVARLDCAVCGRSPVDPAHLVPQRLGGCAHPDCVIPLCRTHHRLYDAGALRLRPYLGLRFRAERAHALLHVRKAALTRALNGNTWPGRSTHVRLGRRGYRRPVVTGARLGARQPSLSPRPVKPTRRKAKEKRT